MTTLAILNPIDPGTGSRVQIRVCSSQDTAATGADGQVWWPAISSAPTLSLSLFDGDFTANVEPGSASMALRIDVLRNSGLFPRVERYDWAGAQALLYRLVDGALVDLATMRVERFAMEDFGLGLSLSVDPEPFEADVLFNEYAGTTGIEGGASLKGTPKPWVFGRALNVEPVFIDEIDNVFQVSGYGPVSAIPAIYERGASFGTSAGNFADYAALVAADLAPGQWATCLALGLFRLGAPPAGVITCDVDGDTTVGFLRRTGAIIKEVARRLGLSASINAASFDALDTAVARNVNIVINQQTSLLDLARRMARACNAVCGIDLDGRLIVSRVAFGSEQFTLDAQGRQMPPVLGMARQNTSPPYRRIVMGANRSWRVHTLDEIAFYSTLTERGAYDALTVYREGDIVVTADGSRWVYINLTATAGNAPPTWPTLSNAHWENLSGPGSGSSDGLNNATITIYQRAASAPALPSLTNTYTFSTGALSALNNGWSQTFPADNGQPLWVSTVFKSSTAATAEILAGEWAAATQLVVSGADGIDGINGTNGLNNARVLIYQRAASVPTLPSAPTTFTFATGALTGLNNGWSTTIPAANGNPLYVSAATASNTTATDTIAAGEWATPVIIVQDGAPGGNGLNSAAVFIYQRAASAPAAPTATATYTFSSGAITGLNNGWSATVPVANGQPLWVRQASASSVTATDTIAAGEWSAAQQLAADGVAGGNTAVVYIYQRAASSPASPPSNTLTYTFATGVLSGTFNNGWSATIPAADGSPLWIRTAVAFSSDATDTIATGEWSSSVRLAQDGAPGPAGLNNAAVFIYKRAATAPTDTPATGAVYTFATGALTGTLNGWTTTVPAANGNPLWVRQASASATTATDTIANTEWSAVQQLTADGAAGGNTSVVYVYQRSATAPANPPTNTLTYTFGTGVLSGTFNNGWSATIPAANGNPLWVRTAVAFSAGATDTIATGEWSSSVQLSADGSPGPAITLVANSGAFTFTDNVADPVSQSITIDALLTNLTGTVTWTSTPTVTLTGTGNSRTLSLANFGANRQVTVQASLGGITQVYTVIRLERNITAPGNTNLVRFSRMEGNRGWNTPFSSIPITTATRPVSFAGKVYIRTDGAPTASGQQMYVGVDTPNQFSVIAGERLSVSADIEAVALTGSPPSFWQLYVDFLNAAGVNVGSATIASGTGNRNAGTRLADFVTVPANAVRSALMLRVDSGSAGALYSSIEGPMVARAAVGQTQHPAYTPGPNSDDGSDVTAAISGPADIILAYKADLTLLSPLPTTGEYKLNVAGQGAVGSGVTWAVTVLSGSFAGTAPSVVGTGSAQLRINSALTSPEAQLEMTATVAGKTYPPFGVTVRRQIAAPSLAPLTNISTSSFAIAHDTPIQITLPSSATSVTLTAVADLFIDAILPQGGTSVEGKWQRESSPGTWVDVGAAATSSPNPEVFEVELAPGEVFYTAEPGSITCNRTATGLAGGSVQRFRFVARVSLGNVRLVTFLGNASATA